MSDLRPQDDLTQRRRWTVEAVRALGLTTDLPTAGQILGMSRSHAYELARRGEFPVPVLRIGSRLRVATTHLLELRQPASESRARSGDRNLADPSCQWT
jgi:hypothetical protein